MPTKANAEGELSLRQIEMLEILATARTFGQAAEKAGISRETLRLWLLEPTFKQAYREVKASTFAGIAQGLLSLGESAIDAYSDVLKAPACPGYANLSRTADSIIANLFKLKDLSDFEDRLAVIEQRLEEANGHSD